MSDVRAATEGDLAAINDIYNHFIADTHVTFDTDPITTAARAEWFTHYATTGRHRVLVACEDDRVVGFTSSSRWRPKAAYETSVETSVYVAPEHIGKGIGSELYQALFQTLTGEDVHRAYAGIAMPNDASVALHERFGFKRVAYFTEQGRKFGKYWDVAWFEKEM